MSDFVKSSVSSGALALFGGRAFAGGVMTILTSHICKALAWEMMTLMSASKPSVTTKLSVWQPIHFGEQMRSYKLSVILYGAVNCWGRVSTCVNYWHSSVFFYFFTEHVKVNNQIMYFKYMLHLFNTHSICPSGVIFWNFILKSKKYQWSLNPIYFAICVVPW